MHEGYEPGSALVVVDVQNDFADPAGSLAVRDGSAILPLLNDEIAAARAAGAFVAHTQDWHPPITPHFAIDGGTWPVHCVAGTWGAQLHPGLVADAGPCVRKGANGEDGYSGFTMRDPQSGATVPTELDGLLRSHGVQRIIVGGLATDYCVKATVLDALSLGYETSVLVDAIRSVDLAPGDGERALAEMERAGAVMVRAAAPVGSAAVAVPVAAAAAGGRS
jgi:nicotinamidase/pyrazinamidase